MKRVRRKRRKSKFAIDNAKIGSTLRIRLPNDYMRNITDYDPDKEQKLKQWCVDKALSVTTLNQDGNTVMPDIIKTAHKIYDWVSK